MGWQIMRRVILSNLRKSDSILPLVILSLIAVSIIVLFCNPLAVQSQEKDYPDPFSPVANATDIPVTQVVFQWKHYYAGTIQYTIQLSKNIDMSQPVFTENVTGDSNTNYKYWGNLEYDTIYFWRVWASDPLGGVKSPTMSFTTVSESAAQTASPPSDDSDSSGGFFDDINWALIGPIAAAVLVVAVVGYFFLRPKRPSNPRGQRQAGWQGPAGAQQMCPSCGTQNTPGRKFCGNCGTTLARPSQQPAMGTPQTGICSNCGTSNPPGRKFCGNCGTTMTMQSQQPAMGIPQTGTCSNCGTSNPPGQKFCGNCGTTVGPPNQQPAAGMPQTNICSTCGAQNTPDRKFCNNCGSNLAGPVQQQNTEVIQSYSCPICGAAIMPGSNPCSNCGTWLDWG
jgi:ribosomal protein L32